jgi:hypothetical protein
MKVLMGSKRFGSIATLKKAKGPSGYQYRRTFASFDLMRNSYPQRHDDISIIVPGFACDAHLRLSIGILELERDLGRGR